MTQVGSYYGLPLCYLLGGIKVHVGDNMIILDMSGKGCRFLETLYDNKLNWIDFIGKFLCTEGSHLSRLDIAGDDNPKEGEKTLLSFPRLVWHTKTRRYISTARRKVWIDGDEQNVVFGAPASDRRLRIYNKALERKYDGHWIRAEFQLRNDMALSFYMTALDLGSIGQAYSGLMLDYLRFTNEINDDNHSERKTVCRWWTKFLGTSKKIKGFRVGGLEYNMQTLEDVLFKQTASSMKTYMRIKEGDLTKFFESVENSKFNKKQDFFMKAEILRNKISQEYNE